MTKVWLESEWRTPTNTAAHQKGGIHDDATANKLGFRGGTVAGSIHMEQFPPLLETAFGAEWWRTGTLSLYFKSATLDGEPVRCFVSEIETHGTLKRATVWMENEDGTLINAGTASVGGPDAESELRQRLGKIRPAGELRMLQNVNMSDLSEGVPTRIPASSIDEQMTVITEPLDCYTSGDRFGGRVLPMTRIVGGFDAAEQILVEQVQKPFVGLYGAIEVEFVNGPVFADTDYLGGGRVCGLSDSPQTEILWRDMVLSHDDTVIARMLKMDRLMKNSSPLWE